MISHFLFHRFLSLPKFKGISFFPKNLLLFYLCLLFGRELSLLLLNGLNFSLKILEFFSEQLKHFYLILLIIIN